MLQQCLCDVWENSRVTLTSGKKTYNGKEINNGQYQFTIPNQKIGTRLTITATNSTGDKQTKTIIIRKNPGTTISMNDVMVTSTTVTGTTFKTEKSDKVEVIIGNKTYTGSIKSNRYSVKIPKQKADTTVKVYVVDPAGNILYTVIKRVK